MNALKIQSKTKQSFKQLGMALTQFDKALQIPKGLTGLEVDGSIQRFEFCIELFWKALKRLLADLGKETEFSRETLQAAYQGHLIDDEEIWISMLTDRNKTSHTYEETLANEIYSRLTSYSKVMQKNYQSIIKKYDIAS